MKQFMDKDFLLQTSTARHLYHDFSKTLPIIDYHCHISPKEIADDLKFDNITQLWLGGDHYKWRFMRSCGVAEYYITGDASDKDKFMEWARVLGKAIGNPLYHWSHLELQRYFDYHQPLSSANAEDVWDICNRKLASPMMSVRNLIRLSNVKVICTTDNPIDDLLYHEQLQQDSSFQTLVLPAWRPDEAMNIENSGFIDYLKKLESVSGIAITSFDHLKKALRNRMNYFASHGCLISDYGLEYVMYAPATDDMIEQIFQKRMNQVPLNSMEIKMFKTAFMLFSGRECAHRNWVMQLHYGCKRDNNTKQMSKLGANTGYDCILNSTPANELADFLDALEQTSELPKTILYSLNPIDNATIGTIIGCFQNEEAIAKIQQGSAWWFNDHKSGIEDQLSSLASLGNLSGFVGMLTDSRSFLSYTRHEYFRRILCNMIGNLVENGEFPDNDAILKEIIEDISYNNANRYFGFSKV